MREIKFRHYDTRLEEMRYSDKNDGEFYINLKGVMYMYAIPKSESGLETEFYKSYGVMQYTGCKDSKGADIYEGDIVYVAGFGVAAAEIHREDGVVFNDYNCNYRQFIDAHVENDIGHIVGNIHQNPELLEGNK